jgi:hypothetical protein
MDGDPGALATPRRSGPEVVGSNPTGPTKRLMRRRRYRIASRPAQILTLCDSKFFHDFSYPFARLNKHVYALVLVGGVRVAP